jgi:hypothetical protein
MFGLECKIIINRISVADIKMFNFYYLSMNMLELHFNSSERQTRQYPKTPLELLWATISSPPGLARRLAHIGY